MDDVEDLWGLSLIGMLRLREFGDEKGFENFIRI